MRIVILGAGQVGGSLATHLSREENDITIVDTDARRLEFLQDRVDLRTVHGFASHPQILKQAGTADADMLIAVTSSDEVNIVACHTAKRLYRVTKCIARVRENDYLTHADALLVGENGPADVLISPEALVTSRLENILHHPGALQVIDFAGGTAQMGAVRVTHGGVLTGEAIADARHLLGEIDLRIVAVFRGDKSLVPQSETVIEADDEVFFVSERRHMSRILHALRPNDRPYHRVLIAGGGNIGENLAARISDSENVKVIERDFERCKQLSERLPHATILHGNVADPDLLTDEGIDGVDMFVAVTNDDESNVIASLLAKKLGARTVTTLINNPIYVDVIQGEQIDVAVSPQQSTIGALLTYVRRGDVVAVHSLRRGGAEILEAVAHGDHRTSRVVGRRVGDVPLPPFASFGAIIRHEKFMIAHDEIEIEENDHLIVFVPNPSALRAVEKLFQVSFGFF